jgi:hypothetical protein
MKLLYHPSKRCQPSDLIDWFAHRDFCVADYRLRLIADRYRVSLATRMQASQTEIEADDV